MEEEVEKNWAGREKCQEYMVWVVLTALYLFHKSNQLHSIRKSDEKIFMSEYFSLENEFGMPINLNHEETFWIRWEEGWDGGFSLVLRKLIGLFFEVSDDIEL